MHHQLVTLARVLITELSGRPAVPVCLGLTGFLGHPIGNIKPSYVPSTGLNPLPYSLINQHSKQALLWSRIHKDEKTIKSFTQFKVISLKKKKSGNQIQGYFDLKLLNEGKNISWQRRCKESRGTGELHRRGRSITAGLDVSKIILRGIT